MITPIVTVKGGEYAIDPAGKLRPVKTHYGLSADSKPVSDIRNGERFFEMDTGSVYLFDETNKAWHEI